jgi:hypothetical protein
MRRSALWPTLLSVACLVTACGANEPSASQVAPQTKNAAKVAKPSSAIVGASPRGACSPLGAIHRSNPVFVAPPEPNVAEDSFTSDSGDDCSFLAKYGRGPWNIAQPGLFEFQWSDSKTVGPVVVEISRDGLVWQALQTTRSAAKPNSASARISLTGQVYVRARPNP